MGDLSLATNTEDGDNTAPERHDTEFVRCDGDDLETMPMRDAWLFAYALFGLPLWATFRLVRLLFVGRYGSAVLAGLVVGRIAVDRGW